jgi:hypothetical protein
VLYDQATRPPGSWEPEPTHDRIMLALQYLTALIAVAAAGLLDILR